MRPFASTRPERGGLVYRLPRDRQLATRTPLTLTPRGLELLDAVDLHGFLTVALIERALFPPPPGGRRSPCSRAYERVPQLWLWDYLDRLEQPIAPSLGGQRPDLYTLGRPAVPLVQQRRNADWSPVRVRRLERLDPSHLEHDLKAAALWANLTAVLRGSRVRRFRWIPERELRARKLRVPDPDTRRWLPFLPDGFYEVTYPVWEPRPTLVETDTGKLNLERFRRKVRAWEAYLDTGRFRRAFHRESFEVVVLARSKNRMQNLWKEARAHVPDDRWWAYRFATWDALEPAKFGGKRWVDLERTWGPLLDPRAFTAPADPREEYAAGGADDEDDEIDEEEDRTEDISPRHWRDEDEDEEDVA